MKVVYFSMDCRCRHLIPNTFFPLSDQELINYIRVNVINFNLKLIVSFLLQMSKTTKFNSLNNNERVIYSNIKPRSIADNVFYSVCIA